MITKIDAVRSLFGRDSYNKCNSNGVVSWKDGHSTTAEENSQIDAEFTRLQTEYDSQDYARKRQAEYPDIYDYIDGVVKSDQAQIDKYIADCQAVKDKYSKGE
jgi:hypothetical protein